MPPTSFTRHAWMRVLERLSLSPAEVAVLLDGGLTVPVGARGRAVHQLFFSPPDAQCFVAVQDNDNGAVITVLPLDYHESCAWPVALGAQQEAEALSSPLSSTGALHCEVPGASVFRAGCYFTNGQGGLRSANLGSIPADPFDHQVSLLLEDDRTIDELQHRVEIKRRLGEVLVRLFVRLGRQGPVTLITLSVAPPTELFPAPATEMGPSPAWV